MSDNKQYVRLQVLHGTAEEWNSIEEDSLGELTPEVAEPCYNTTDNELRLGDGAHTWKELKPITPLVPNRPIYVSKPYAEIRNDIIADDDTIWLDKEDRYAFWHTDFNRTAIVGDKFWSTCSSSDGYVFTITAEVVRSIPGGRVNFKILDTRADETDDFIVYYNPSQIPLTIQCVMNLTSQSFYEDGINISKKGITYQDLESKKATSGSLTTTDIVSTWGRKWFNRDARAGDEFFAIALTQDNYSLGLNCQVIKVDTSENDYGRPYWGITDVEVLRYPSEETTLVSNVGLEFSKTYKHIIRLVRNDEEVDSFPVSGFNRRPYINERFFAICTTSDKRAIGITAQVTKFVEDSAGNEYAVFKCQDVVLLGDDYPILHRTMLFSGITPDEFMEVDEEGKYTFKGYYGHHSIGTDLFSIPPRSDIPETNSFPLIPGNHFFGTAILRNNNSEVYNSVVTFTAKVTSITNDKVNYELVDVTLLHDGDIDEMVKNRLPNTVSKSGDTMTGDLLFSGNDGESANVGVGGAYFENINRVENTNIEPAVVSVKNPYVNTKTSYLPERIEHEGRKLNFPDLRYHIPEEDDTSYYPYDETLATEHYVYESVENVKADKVSKSGDTMTGDLVFNDGSSSVAISPSEILVEGGDGVDASITSGVFGILSPRDNTYYTINGIHHAQRELNFPEPNENGDDETLATENYVDTNAVSKSGDTMTGDLIIDDGSCKGTMSIDSLNFYEYDAFGIISGVSYQMNGIYEAIDEKNHQARNIFFPRLRYDESGDNVPTLYDETLASEAYVYEMVKNVSSPKLYKHHIISGDFTEYDLCLYVITPNPTSFTNPTDIGSQLIGAQTKLYVLNGGRSFSQVLSIGMPDTIYYLDEGAITGKKLSFSSFVDNVVEI